MKSTNSQHGKMTFVDSEVTSNDSADSRCRISEIYFWVLDFEWFRKDFIQYVPDR